MNWSTIKNNCPVIGRKCMVDRTYVIFRARMEYNEEGDLVWMGYEDTFTKGTLVQSTDYWRYC